ncbi:chorismate synthase [bacterium]|nr:chorismate synthase [bacterium]
MYRINILTAGESHGKCLIGIIEGVPAHLELGVGDFRDDAKRRRMGIGRSSRMKKEDCDVEILSGVRLGKTTGAPITIRIENAVYQDWRDVMQIEAGEGSEAISIPRPGHADFTGSMKFGLADIRDVIERASGRETATRCALGTIAKVFLRKLGIEIISRPLVIGDVRFEYGILHPSNRELPQGLSQIKQESEKKYNENSEKLVALRKSLEDKGDTVGGIFQVITYGVPVGLGSYTQAEKRIDARLGYSILSIPSVKAFGAGAIFAKECANGLDYIDGFDIDAEGISRKSNNLGGIEGGITNGEPIILTGILKPVPTTRTSIQSVDLDKMIKTDSLYENADIWVVEPAGVIAEGQVALILMDAVLEKFGGDSIKEIEDRFTGRGFNNN